MIVITYVPANKLLKSCVVGPVLHWYWYGLVPPVTVLSIEPVAAPKQLLFTILVLSVKAVVG